MLYYSNQFSLSVNDQGTEYILRFSQRSPNLSPEGEVTSIDTETVAQIVLTRDGYEALRGLLGQSVVE